MQETIKIIALMLFGIIISMVLGIGFYTMYQSNKTLSYQLKQIQQSWEDSTQAVIEALQFREVLNERVDEDKRVILAYKDDCMDKPYSDVNVIRVLNFPEQPSRGKQ